MQPYAAEITGHTRTGALIGSPVAHSISPQMYNESFKQRGIDRVYVCFDIGPDKLAHTVQAFRDLDFFGFNLTMPHKTAVIPYLDDLSEEARLIGAVNTVDNRDGRLIGYNTDGMGFFKSAKVLGYDPAGKTVTLLGAGGAASAIAAQAALDGVKTLHMFSRRGRSWDKANALIDRIRANTDCNAMLHDFADRADLKSCKAQSYMLINATSVGMAPHEAETPVPDTSFFFPDLIVADVIYNPAKTRFLQDAEKAGCRTFNGMYMLLYQGEAAFKIWTGCDMPVEIIREKYF